MSFQSKRKNRRRHRRKIGEGMPAPTAGALATPMATLKPSRRALAACRKLGVENVGQFLARARRDFLKQRGCGPRTYDELEQKVRMHLMERSGTDDRVVEGADQRPLLSLVDDDRATKAFLSLGITTVAEFLATPKEELLACPGFGERTWQKVMDRIRDVPSTTGGYVGLLPTRLLQRDVMRLNLPRALSRRLLDMGCTTVGHLLALPASAWEEGAEPGPEAEAEVRSCLDRLLLVGLQQADDGVADEELDYPTLKARLLAPLQESDRQLVAQVVGIDTPPRSIPEIALARDLDLNRATSIADAARWRLHERAPSVVCRMRDELMRELDAFEGIVTGEHLAVGTLAHTMARASGDRRLPLRLMAFCFPDEFHLHQGCLTAMPPRQFRRLLRRLRERTDPTCLPVSLPELIVDLQPVVDPVPRGLLLYLIKNVCMLTVQIDGQHGEMVMQSNRSVAVRLRDILAEEGRPLTLEDLVFHYRDRYRSARKRKLRNSLRRDPSFLEVGRDLWSLRAWHQDELAAAAKTAERLAARICQLGGKHNVADLVAEERPQERTVYLTTDCLRRDERVRYLGRGDFCPATTTRSQVLDQLLKDFRRAMGEVPLSRFLENQPPHRRRLVTTLLRENRLFVQPAPDRIDVLTNYPFNEERMGRLLELTDKHLAGRGGYSHLDELLAEVNETDLGGGWMNEVLLGELLRRHGNFELLPAGVIARREMELMGWLQARAREALRKASLPLTVPELLVEEPELTEFEECLSDLLQMDPMIQTPDGQRFQVV